MKSYTKLLAIGALATSVVAGPVAGQAAEKVLKFASFVPPIYILHKPVFEKLASDLDAATNGSVKIKIYASGELGKGPAEQYKRAVSGIADLSYGLPGYTSSVFPKTLLLELPGVTTSSADATAKLWKIMDSHLRAEFKRTRPIALFVTPPSVFMMRDKPIRKLEDLAGLKIRAVSKSAAAVLEAYGATPVQMPANKVYTAMNTGVVDGALMGSDSLLIFKLIETSKYITRNLPEMPAIIFLVMNEGVYNGLSADERKAMDGLSGLDISQRSAAGLKKFGEIAQSKFAAIEGKEIIDLSAEERAKFDAKAAEAVVKLAKEMEGRGIPANAILEAVKN